MRRDPARSVILLQPTDFELEGAQRVVVTGPSGSGKSVFLRSLALLDPVDAGEIQWHEKAITRARIPAYRRRVAYIAQRPAMLDGSVEDNLRYPFSLRVYRDASFDRATVSRLAKEAGRGTDFLDKRASELSGGEAQIAALIRVLQLAPRRAVARRTHRVARSRIGARHRSIGQRVVRRRARACQHLGVA